MKDTLEQSTFLPPHCDNPSAWDLIFHMSFAHSFLIDLVLREWPERHFPVKIKFKHYRNVRSIVKELIKSRIS